MARVVCLREWLKWVVREGMRQTNLEAVNTEDGRSEYEEQPETPESAHRCTPRWTASRP
jgi:hypothetical protein